MDPKDLVALWYSATALVIARLVFAVSGMSIAISVGVVLLVLAVPVVRARHRVLAERQVVSAGAPLLIGPLVLGVVLVGQWRAQSVVTIAQGTAKAGDTRRTLGEPTPSDETIAGKVLALADPAIGAVAPRERMRPTTSGLPAGPSMPDLLPDNRGTGRSDESCQSADPHGERPRPGNDQQVDVHPRSVQQEDGCAAESAGNTKQLKQARRIVSDRRGRR